MQSKAYRLFDFENNKIIIRRDVVFNETLSWNWHEKKEKERQQQVTPVPDINDEQIQNLEPTPMTPTTPSSTSSQIENEKSSSAELSTPTIHRKYRSLADIYETCGFALMSSDPATYEEARGHAQWEKAMIEEISAINKNNTWILCELPTESKAIGLKWVFKTKYNSAGEIQQHKARLVVKGYSKQAGVNFEETFFLVARFETVRIFLALAA